MAKISDIEKCLDIVATLQAKKDNSERLSISADVPKSAARKAQRGMSSVIYFCSVTKTTCRGLTLSVIFWEFWHHGLCKLALISGEHHLYNNYSFQDVLLEMCLDQSL
ncbi:hypothetical protein MTR67_008852 [Solanum verrucosum]|uniref:Uncharacterized protein n=1 Tax=Solanum verrucosum TaxID=315347 RepID=A0AAF0Q332_SOLVR|nr:hypothetical protein MTR67_008852 [Solanum verrucosum]